ncbi:MAG: hypothetical protein KAG82_02685 [Alcanivoracaceae bacterium]|nr:hypothetical protein [Alcanivoracaceae bacterium]
MTSKNLEINYLYRDAANYKQYASVVVPNPKGLTPEQVKAALLQYFAADQVWPDILHFRPEDLGWPTAYFDDHDEEGDDLNLHELEDVKPSDAKATEGCELPSLMGMPRSPAD